MAQIDLDSEHEPQQTAGAAEASGAGGLLRDLFSRELLRYLGPGFVVTIGFIDPGNWATNIAGGSQFGYQLLWVISLSTLMLIFLQHIAARLGIVSGRSLAANVRSRFSRPLGLGLRRDDRAGLCRHQLAEFLGAALGFALLLHIPLCIGAPLTLVINYLLIAGRQYDSLERVIIVFLAVIALCYIIELFIVHPDWGAAAAALGHTVGLRQEHPRRHGHARRDRHAAQHLPALRHHPVARVGRGAAPPACA